MDHNRASYRQQCNRARTPIEDLVLTTARSSPTFVTACCICLDMADGKRTLYWSRIRAFFFCLCIYPRLAWTIVLCKPTTTTTTTILLLLLPLTTTTTTYYYYYYYLLLLRVSAWGSEWVKWVSEWGSEGVSEWVSEWASEWVSDVIIIIIMMMRHDNDDDDEYL